MHVTPKLQALVTARRNPQKIDDVAPPPPEKAYHFRRR